MSYQESEKKENYSLSSFQIQETKTPSSSEVTKKSPVSNFFKSFKLEKDLEIGGADVVTPEDTLKEYQVKLIAIASCIGSGLFISSAAVLSSAGPAGTMIGYSVVAILIFFVTQALGELTSAYPVRGNFLIYFSRFIDESWAFAMNWNYCLQWMVTIPLSLVSASLTIEYWNDEVNAAVWVSIFFVAICCINIVGVRGYGYAESVFSIMKVTAITGFCILSVVLIAGGGEQGYIGGKNWHPPFANGFKGTCNTLVNAAFSFAGTELVALAAGEAPNPRRALQRAIKQVFWRIGIFYILSVLLICFLVPYNDPRLLGNSGSSASPFVVAIANGGIKILPSIFNAVILLSVVSVANAAVFATYKPLVAIAEAGHGPKFLAYVDRKGRPIFSILVALASGLLGFIGASNNQETVFLWLMAISGLSCMFIWFSISLVQVRVNYACKVQGISRDNIPFKAIGGDYGAYLSMILNVLILIAQFYVALYPISGEPLNATNFFQAYLAAPIVLVSYIGHKVWTRNWQLYIKAEDMDLTTGRNSVDSEWLKQEMAEEAERWTMKPWYYRLFHTWC